MYKLDANREWVWIIAGGLLQIPLIKEAQGRGFAVLVTDRDTEAPGCRLADKVIPLDTYDFKKHRNLALVLNVRPKAVLTAGADVGMTVSAVAEALFLHAVTFETAQRVNNKAKLRETLHETSRCQEHPNSLVVHMEGTTANMMRHWKTISQEEGSFALPVVVKPADNSATRGMSLVHTWKEKDWGRALVRANRAFKHDKHVILEEYLEETEEVALDFFVNEGQLVFANGAYRLFYRNLGFGIEAGHLNPWVPNEVIMAFCQDIAVRLGVNEGPFKIDLAIHPVFGPCVLECATRLSGGFDHMFTAPLATGKDITGAMLDYALGLGIDRQKLTPTKERYACAIAPLFPPGKIQGWIGDGTSLPGVRQVFIREKQEIKPLKDCAGRPAFVMADGATRAEALAHAKAGAEALHPIYEDEASGMFQAWPDAWGADPAKIITSYEAKGRP